MKPYRYLAAGIFSVFLIPGYATPADALTDTGKALETKCATMQTALKAEIEAVMSKLNDAKTHVISSRSSPKDMPSK